MSAILILCDFTAMPTVESRALLIFIPFFFRYSLFLFSFYFRIYGFYPWLLFIYAASWPDSAKKQKINESKISAKIEKKQHVCI